MTETYEEALARVTAECRRLGPIPSDLMPYVERDARSVLEIQELPILESRLDKYGNERYYCPECGRRLSKNYGTKDDQGYASLNCVEHGWVGKWKR